MSANQDHVCRRCIVFVLTTVSHEFCLGSRFGGFRSYHYIPCTPGVHLYVSRYHPDLIENHTDKDMKVMWKAVSLTISPLEYIITGSVAI